MEKNGRRLLNIKELSDWLGIPVWQIRNLVRQHRIPVIHIDRRLRFDIESIDKWLKENEENPVEVP